MLRVTVKVKGRTRFDNDIVIGINILNTFCRVVEIPINGWAMKVDRISSVSLPSRTPPPFTLIKLILLLQTILCYVILTNNLPFDKHNIVSLRFKKSYSEFCPIIDSLIRIRPRHSYPRLGRITHGRGTERLYTSDATVVSTLINIYGMN